MIRYVPMLEDFEPLTACEILIPEPSEYNPEILIKCPNETYSIRLSMPHNLAASISGGAMSNIMKAYEKCMAGRGHAFPIALDKSDILAIKNASHDIKNLVINLKPYETNLNAKSTGRKVIDSIKSRKQIMTGDKANKADKYLVTAEELEFLRYAMRHPSIS